MDHLPKNDIPMLVSAINFLLRDEEFDNLDQICYHFNIARNELEAKLARGGFRYSEEHKRFWWEEARIENWELGIENYDYSCGAIAESESIAKFSIHNVQLE